MSALFEPIDCSDREAFQRSRNAWRDAVMFDFRLSSSAFRVACYLASRATFDRGAFPSQRRIALALNMPRSCVQTALAALEARHWIRRVAEVGRHHTFYFGENSMLAEILKAERLERENRIYTPRSSTLNTDRVDRKSGPIDDRKSGTAMTGNSVYEWTGNSVTTSKSNTIELSHGVNPLKKGLSVEEQDAGCSALHPVEFDPMMKPVSRGPVGAKHYPIVGWPDLLPCPGDISAASGTKKRALPDDDEIEEDATTRMAAEAKLVRMLGDGDTDVGKFRASRIDPRLLDNWASRIHAGTLTAEHRAEISASAKAFEVSSKERAS